MRAMRLCRRCRSSVGAIGGSQVERTEAWMVRSGHYIIASERGSGKNV